MQDGGVLTVTVEPSGDDWQINFADTGHGMSPQQTEKIFEPFQSGFDGGTGLGLAIVYQIAQAHEGKVWARSRLGRRHNLCTSAAAFEFRSTAGARFRRRAEGLADE